MISDINDGEIEIFVPSLSPHLDEPVFELTFFCSLFVYFFHIVQLFCNIEL